MQTKLSFFFGLVLSGALMPVLAGDLAPKAFGPVAAASANKPVKSVLDARLNGARGQIDIVVQLGDPSLAGAHAKNTKKTGGWLTAAQQRS